MNQLLAIRQFLQLSILSAGRRGVVHVLLGSRRCVRFGASVSFRSGLGWLWHLPGEITTEFSTDESATRFRYSPLADAGTGCIGVGQAKFASVSVSEGRCSQAPVLDGAVSSALGSACCAWIRGKIHEESGGPTSSLQRATWVCTVRLR